MRKLTSLLIALAAIQAHGETYQKRVIPQAATPEQVEAIVGASIRTEKIWGTGLFEGTLIGEKWNFSNRTREGYQISWAEFEVRWDPKPERVFRSSDIKYEPETLTQRKGLMERFSSGDVSIEAASLTMSYYNGQRSFPFYAVHFSHSNKTKEQIREVTFYVELLDDFDAPVDSNATYTLSPSYTPFVGHTGQQL